MIPEDENGVPKAEDGVLRATVEELAMSRRSWSMVLAQASHVSVPV